MVSGSRRVAWTIAGVAALTIAGALASEHVFGLVPCALCLQQRWPYYLGIPLAVATALAPARPRQIGLAALGLVFAGSALLAAYHAGVEWSFWPGPTDCAGGGASSPTFDGFLQTLEKARVANCAEAAWRFAGISLAGWNALISAGLAVAAVAAAIRNPRSGVHA